MRHLLLLPVIALLAIFLVAGCGGGSSQGGQEDHHTGSATKLDRPPADAVSPRAPTKDVEVLKVELDPVGDSVTSGTATFREKGGVLYLELEATGLPKDAVVYFGEVHPGVCQRAQEGRASEPEHADVSRRTPAAKLRFDLLSARSPEYAHEGGHADADVLVGSVGGTGRVVTGLEDYKSVSELLSGRTKSLDLHAPSQGDPTIACGDIT